MGNQMRAKKIMMLFLVLTILLSGCNFNKTQQLKNENEQLRKKIVEMEKEIQGLKAEVASLKREETENKSISINYQSYDYKQRFVQKQATILALPRKESIELNIIPSNSVVQVLDAAMLDELWLYVQIPVYDTPANLKGWIRKAETLPFTKENQQLVQSDVIVKTGTLIYEVFEFEKIQSIKPTKTNFDVRGRLEEKKEGYARLSCPGAWGFWVKENHIVYPSI